MTPTRTCIGCRVADDPSRLVRLAVVDGRIVLDPARRLPGRGAWIHPDPACVRAADRRRAWARAFRAPDGLDASAVRAMGEAPL